MEMLLIEDVKVHIVPQNVWAIEKFLSDGGVERSFLPTNKGEDLLDAKVCREIIRGRAFVDRHGRRVCIGVSSKAAEVLGLQYEAWANMDAELERARSELRRANERIYLCERASWWQRLKWVFTGVKIKGE
jgi:hypothetical protein